VKFNDLLRVMKKVLLVIIAASFAFGVNAQVRFGLKAGGTLSSITSKYDGVKDDVWKAGIGFQLGGILEYSFSESFALQPELLYVLHNIKIKDNVEEFDGVNTRTELQSIQLPVNLKYKMGTENLKFYVTAGPYLGYLVSAKQKVTTDGVNVAVDLFEFSETKMKHFDFGLGVGFGVEITKFAVGVGYQYGIANLTGLDNASSKLGTFNLSLGYFF
jgi:hypothetical protein